MLVIWEVVMVVGYCKVGLPEEVGFDAVIGFFLGRGGLGSL